MTQPMTTFTRAIQPPLRGMRCRYDGNTASRKNGSARPGANVTMPTNGRILPPDTDAPSRGPPEGPQDRRRGEAEAGEKHDDSQAEHQRLHDALAAPPGWPVQKVGHRDGDHREHAGREDGGQAEAEGYGEKSEQPFRGRARCG